jgi:hypothetical protein
MLNLENLIWPDDLNHLFNHYSLSVDESVETIVDKLESNTSRFIESDEFFKA